MERVLLATDEKNFLLGTLCLAVAPTLCAAAATLLSTPLRPCSAATITHIHQEVPSPVTWPLQDLCSRLDRATTRLLIQGKSQLLILEEQLCQQQLQPTDPCAKIANHFRSSF